jgi:hypothetical protein
MRYTEASRAFSTQYGAASALIVLVAVSFGYTTLAQGQAPTPPTNAASLPPRVERLGADLLRVGNVRVDTARKEMTVRGVATEAQILEFVAVTKGGRKAYESAFELDTNATDFNLALILVGLDQSRSVPPKVHLDREIPRGDPVEIWVEWDQPGGRRKVRAEQLIYNLQSKTTLSEGPWVYTGSGFSRETGAYLAEVQGTLIGFVHTPSTIIDSPRPLGPGAYGSYVVNPELNLKPGTAVQLSVRAVPRPKQ